MASSLPRRIAVAVVAIPAAVLLVYFGGWPLVFTLQFFAVLGAWEVYRFAAQRNVRPFAALGYVAAAAAPALGYAVLGPMGLAPRWLGFAGVTWVIAVMGTAVYRRAPDDRPLAAIAVTLFAPVYTGVLPSFLLFIRHGADRSALAATALVLLPLVVTWVCDTAAMAGGALLGGAKFAPRVSPNKTWSGTIAGSTAATLVAPLYGWLALARVDVTLGWLELAVLGLVLSAVGQVGDLAESLLKREAGVKDSGGFFPGHGGVLDRLDSLYWVVPGAALLFSVYGVL